MVSQTVQQLRQGYWSVIAWVPESEMTSTSLALQCGQRGSGRGLFRGGERRVLLLLQATQHAESVGVDRAFAAAPAHGVPLLPVDFGLRCLRFHLLFEASSQLGRAHAELAFVM